MTFEQALGLTGSAWNTLEDEEKVAVLQAVENHEADLAGRMACKVEARCMYAGPDGVVLGSYDSVTRTIYINSTQFDPDAPYGKTAEHLVTACVHEGRHAMQHQVADGLVEHEDAEQTAIWRENLANYITSGENKRAYYEQPVEVDARQFAQERYAVLEAQREQMAARQEAREAFERQLQMEEQTPEQTPEQAVAAFQQNAPLGPRQEHQRGLSM